MDYSDDEIEKEEDWFSEESENKNTESQDDVPQENKSKDESEDKEKSKTVKRKRQVTSSSRVKLNINTLMGPNGLERLKKSFENFEFKGNNHEKEDLTKIIQILQHWMCYQLFPKGSFKSNMAQLESLGNKKDVQALMKKFRLGIDSWGEQKSDNVENHDICQSVGNDKDNSENNFDSCLEQHMAFANSDNDLSMDGEPQSQKETEVTITSSQPIKTSTEITLTPEQIERIARNRKLAEERRLQRLMNEKTHNDSDSVIMEGQI